MMDEDHRKQMRKRLLASVDDSPIGHLKNHDHANEWSETFEALMRNRLLVGAYRYGPMRQNGKPSYARVDAMMARLRLYLQTLNQEYLVDVANLAMLEFVEPPAGAHFEAADDGEHVGLKR